MALSSSSNISPLILFSNNTSSVSAVLSLPHAMRTIVHTEFTCKFLSELAVIQRFEPISYIALFPLLDSLQCIGSRWFCGLWVSWCGWGRGWAPKELARRRDHCIWWAIDGWSNSKRWLVLWMEFEKVWLQLQSTWWLEKMSLWSSTSPAATELKGPLYDSMYFNENKNVDLNSKFYRYILYSQLYFKRDIWATYSRLWNRTSYDWTVI
jgi:hypothetical protein